MTETQGVQPPWGVEPAVPQLCPAEGLNTCSSFFSFPFNKWTHEMAFPSQTQSPAQLQPRHGGVGAVPANITQV